MRWIEYLNEAAEDAAADACSTKEIE